MDHLRTRARTIDVMRFWATVLCACAAIAHAAAQTPAQDGKWSDPFGDPRRHAPDGKGIALRQDRRRRPRVHPPMGFQRYRGRPVLGTAVLLGTETGAAPLSLVVRNAHRDGSRAAPFPSSAMKLTE